MTFTDGFESGNLSSWPTVSGNAAATSLAAYEGSYGARFSPVSGTGGSIATSTTKWTQNTFTWAFLRLKFRFGSLTPGSNAAVCTLQNALQADNFDFFHDAATGTIHFDLNGAQGRDTGIVPVIGHWYDLQARIFFGATTYTAEVQLDGVNLGGVLNSTGETSSFVRSLTVGEAGTTETYVLDVDNVEVDVGTSQPSFVGFTAMAKQGGLGARLLVGGYDLSGDIQALDQVHGGPALLDVTDITQSAHARLGGLRDGTLGFTCYMDPANAHPVLSALPRTDTLLSFLVPPLAVGSPAACLNAKQVNYDPTRGTDGSLLMKVEGQGNGFGAEWGVTLTAGLRTDTAATNGATFDGGNGFTASGVPASGTPVTNTSPLPATVVISGGTLSNVVVNGVSVGTGDGTYTVPSGQAITLTYSAAPTWTWTLQTAFGAQAYLQVTAFTGTSVTVAVQDSADGTSWAAVTGLTFTAVTAAPATQRLATAGNATIRRYLRVVTTGTFNPATFALAINRNLAATAF